MCSLLTKKGGAIWKETIIKGYIHSHMVVRQIGSVD